MRVPPILIAVAAALAGGCAFGANDELRGAVEGAVPSDSDTVGCEWFTNWGSEASDRYACSYLLVGERAVVSSILVSRLRDRGFRVACDANDERTAVQAIRGAVMLNAEIVDNASLQAAFEPAGDSGIPAGSSGVSIEAVDHAESVPQARPGCDL